MKRKPIQQQPIFDLVNKEPEMITPSTEVWALELVGSPGQFVGPALDDDGTESFLAFPTKEQAERGREFQKAMYDMDSEVVRLSPTS